MTRFTGVWRALELAVVLAAVAVAVVAGGPPRVEAPSLSPPSRATSFLLLGANFAGMSGHYRFEISATPEGAEFRAELRTLTSKDEPVCRRRSGKLSRAEFFAFLRGLEESGVRQLQSDIIPISSWGSCNWHLTVGSHEYFGHRYDTSVTPRFDQFIVTSLVGKTYASLMH